MTGDNQDSSKSSQSKARGPEGEATPWDLPGWEESMAGPRDAALATAGYERTGPAETKKSWARSFIQVVPTVRGEVWVKYSYRLPPGEEVVLEQLCKRWPTQVPDVVTTWAGAVAMLPLRGRELKENDSIEEWVSVARVLGEQAAGERSEVEHWLSLGVRDRRPGTWRQTVEHLLASPVLENLDKPFLEKLHAFSEDFIGRYEQGFQSPATLIHQDSGCCNVHITEAGPLIFDWSDVIIGHPTFSCDRLLDQAPRERHAAIIEAFSEPLGLDRAEFNAMRRSNVLHEVLRYHDELSHIPATNQVHKNLSNSVRSQLQVLVDFETRKKSE